MSAPQSAPPRTPPLRRPPDALERLYVYWLVSTVVLLLLLVVTVLIVRGVLHVHGERLDALTTRVDELEQAVQARGVAPPIAPGKAVEPTPSPAMTEAPVATTPPPAEPLVLLPDGPATAPPLAGAPEDGIRVELDALLGEEPGLVDDLADTETAERLVEDGLRQIGRAHWTPVTWARLAVLARLLGRDAAADTLSRQATDGGAWRAHYAEVSARALLDRGRPADALLFVDELEQRHAPVHATRLLRARALMAGDDPAGADRALASLADVVALSPVDRLRLARLWLRLERWDRLTVVLATIADVPEEWAREHAFLTAAAWAREGRCVEALAVLDWLAATAAPPPAPVSGAAPPPGRYEIEVWRGVTLMFAGRTEAGRQALRDAAELDPARADALYYLGVLEARVGRTELAIMHLKNALAGSARLAPAWEVLAGLELDAGRVDEALAHLDQALQINPRRASAHFLRALVYAKVSRPEPAHEALRRALQLDPAYLEAARQADVLVRLFPEEELEQLAAAAAAAPEEL